MNTVGPYGAGDDDLDDLPQLPIPRPGEWSPMAATPQPPAEPRLAPPVLGGAIGGGASFTAAAEGDPDPTMESNGDPGADHAWLEAEHERLEAERFTWQIAARLTSGLLANPARGGASVKDAMGLFDQLLQEMHAYTKIASDFDLAGGSPSERRRQHKEYFQQQRSGAANGLEQPVAAPAPAAPKPEPTQPRPMGDYRPIPPGARGPYTPGSMAGAPPPERQGDDEQAA